MQHYVYSSTLILDIYFLNYYQRIDLLRHKYAVLKLFYNLTIVTAIPGSRNSYENKTIFQLSLDIYLNIKHLLRVLLYCRRDLYLPSKQIVTLNLSLVNEPCSFLLSYLLFHHNLLMMTKKLFKELMLTLEREIY